MGSNRASFMPVFRADYGKTTGKQHIQTIKKAPKTLCFQGFSLWQGQKDSNLIEHKNSSKQHVKNPYKYRLFGTS